MGASTGGFHDTAQTAANKGKTRLYDLPAGLEGRFEKRPGRARRTDYSDESLHGALRVRIPELTNFVKFVNIV
jgi:hypothetical protein